MWVATSFLNSIIAAPISFTHIDSTISAMVFVFFLDGITNVDFSNGLVVIPFILDWTGVPGKSSSSPISSTTSSSSKLTTVYRTASTSSSMSLSSWAVILAPAPSAKSLPTIMLSSFQYSKDFPLKFFASGLDCKINITCINLSN
ncbi:hypothetical protein AMTRI_Chr02g259890 [Amborella trichopoda]